jgi:hypothetical protein
MPVLADEQVGAAAIPTRPQTSLVFFILSFIHGESHKIQELLKQGVTKRCRLMSPYWGGGGGGGVAGSHPMSKVVHMEPK